MLEANPTTVPPAGEVVEGTFQLTDAVLEDLSKQELSNISLFQFPGEDSAKRSFFSGCKTYPGDFFWPSKLAWKVFNLLTGGALIETVPIGAVCYPDSEHYDVTKCNDVIENWTKSETQ